MNRYWMPWLMIATAASSALAGDLGSPPAGGMWSLSASLDLDDEGGYIGSGGVAYLPNENLFFALDVGRSDSSTDLADFESTIASFLADYSFGPVGVSAAVGWYSDDSIADRFRYGGSIYATGAGFRVEATAEDWNSEFDTFRFELPVLALTTTADCEIDNTTLGARASYSGDRFRAYASFRDYDYSSPDCSFGISQFGDSVNDIAVLVDAAPELFRRIARGTLAATRLQLISADSAFLDQSIAAGISWRQDKLEFGLDYSHSEEIFQKLEADTLYGRILFPAGRAVDLELRLGVSDGDQVDGVAFIGATVFWYLATGN